MRVAIGLLLAGWLLGAPTASAQAAPAGVADTVGLRPKLEAVLAAYPGVAGVSARDLRTGKALSIRGAEPFPSASLIKVSILVALLEEVEAHRMRLDEPLAMIARDRVGGSGVLKHLAPGLRLTVGDAAWLMTTLSDNTATNLLLDKLGVTTVWEKMDSLGLPRTRVHRKVFHPHASSPRPDSSVRYGLGVTTPDETTRLFERLHQGRAVSPALDSLALAMLRANQDASKLVRWLPENLRVAHKSGDVDHARNDCGILYTPAAPIALCVMTRENRDTRYSVDNPAHLLIGRLGRLVYQHFNPDAPLPPLPW